METSSVAAPVAGGVVRAPKAEPPNPDPTPALQRLLQGLEAIDREARASLGANDARRMRALLRLGRLCAVRGRAHIHGARTFAQWKRGVGLLASHYILEMANGHSVIHGAYDRLGAGIDARDYEFGNTVVTEDWRVNHNEMHHPWTNLVEADPDFDLVWFRFSDRRAWRPWHLFQVPLVFLLPLTVTWFIPLLLALGRARHEKRSALSWQTLGPPARRVARELVDNYVRPLRGPRPLRTILGHFVAKTCSNGILGAGLFTSHHGEAALDLESADDADRAEMYLRQIMCTLNFGFPDKRWSDIHLRGVDYHIEHHLFPDLPVERLGGLSPKVKGLCDELGIPYETMTLTGAFCSILKLAARYSLPIRTPTRGQRARRDAYRALVDAYRRAKPRRQPKPAVIHRLHLARTGRELAARSDKPVLAALEAEGIAVRTGCRKGACQACRVPKLSGATSQDPKGGRSEVNVCVAKPRGDLVLDL